MALGFDQVAAAIGDDAEIGMGEFVVGIVAQCTIERSFRGVCLVAVKRGDALFD